MDLNLNDFWDWWWFSAILVAMISLISMIIHALEFSYDRTHKVAVKTLVYGAAFLTAPVLWPIPAIYYVYNVLLSLYELFRELVTYALDGDQ